MSLLWNKAYSKHDFVAFIIALVSGLSIERTKTDSVVPCMHSCCAKVLLKSQNAVHVAMESLNAVIFCLFDLLYRMTCHLAIRAWISRVLSGKTTAVRTNAVFLRFYWKKSREFRPKLLICNLCKNMKSKYAFSANPPSARSTNMRSTQSSSFTGRRPRFSNGALKSKGHCGGAPTKGAFRHAHRRRHVAWW